MGNYIKAQGQDVWFKRYEQEGCASQICEEFGISRKAFYRWLRRYQSNGKELSSLLDNSRRPKSHPRAIPEDIAQSMGKMRYKSSYGLRQIASCLERDHGVKVSLYGIQRVLTRAGLTIPHQRREKPVLNQMMLSFFPIEEVQTDCGTELTYAFWSHVQKPHPFAAFLNEKGIRHNIANSGQKGEGDALPPHQ